MENSENNENKCVCTNQGEWQYKSHIIRIKDDGTFNVYFPEGWNLGGFETIRESMHYIDEKVEKNKWFTKCDLKILFDKIDDKEKAFIKNLIKTYSKLPYPSIEFVDNGMKVDFDKLKSFFQ